MLPVLGKPMVERIAEELWQEGIRDLILVIRPDDQEISEHFLNNSIFRGEVHFIIQEKSQGMAKALNLAAPSIKKDFIMSACDNLVPAGQIQAMISQWKRHSDLAGILTLMKLDPAEITSTGIVGLDGDRVTRIVEKPALSEAPSDIGSLPLYLFSQDILKYLSQVAPSPRGEYELQDAIQMLIDHGGQILGMYVPWRLTITSPEDLRQINLHYLAEGANDLIRLPADLPDQIQIQPPVFIEDGVMVGAGGKIGPGVYLEKGCTLGRGVQIRDSVVLRSGRVFDGESVDGRIII